MAAANTSFFFLTGAEIHWRQAGTVNTDPASINTLLTGLTGLVIVEAIFFVVSIFASPYPYNGMEVVVGVWGVILGAIFNPVVRASKPYAELISDEFITRSRPVVERVLSRSARGRELFSRMKIYEAVPLTDYDEEEKFLSNSAPLLDEPTQAERHTPDHPRWTLMQLLRAALIVAVTLYLLVLRCFRPDNESYKFLSQTIIVSPFAGVDAQTKLASITGDSEINGKITALTMPPKLDWLPKGDWPGFRDWQTTTTDPYLHYNSTEDPLHISNLDEEVLGPLRKALKHNDVKIKHILLFKMESTRADVFPVRKGSYVHDRIAESYKGKIPKDVMKRLANLTHTAERLTGTESGYHKNGTVKPYGGIYASNSYTAGTFTLKSIEGTTCGVSPLVIDFNKEYEHHIYQPCLPQILEVLSAQTNDSKSSDYTDWPWSPHFMQSITDTYDHQDRLTPALGFKKENIWTMESIDKHMNDTSFHGEKFNFWGYPDHDLAGYLRNLINNAEKNHERLFIEHLTGLTHQPWDTPGKKYEELISTSWGGDNEDVNKYLNTLGINDKWYGTVLDILEETGVADETLVVMTGDHGISLLENHGITPYDNPHVANFAVPLVLAHPRLPPIEVNSAVTSIQILPTILDLLRESGSLDKNGEKAIKDLLPMYEGQSIIRPIINETESTKNWQFTVMNTGGSMVAMRSAGEPYRLVVPLVPEVEWRFTNLEVDPHETKFMKAFDLETMKGAVGMKFGSEATHWITEAAHAAQWWVADNWRRYEYSP